MFEERNGQRFLTMVLERSGPALLHFKDVSIDSLSFDSDCMRRAVLANTDRLEVLSFRAQDEEECDEVMSRTFGSLRVFGAIHGVNSEDDGWDFASGVVLRELDWLTARGEQLESLRLRRVLVPMDLVGAAVNLRFLSVFGVGRDVSESRRLRLDIAGLCRMGQSLLRLEEWEIGGEVELDDVSRVRSVEMGQLLRLSLVGVTAKVAGVVMGALVMPVVRGIFIQAEGGESETVDALGPVREHVARWGLGVGHLRLGESWRGNQVRLRADYECGRCELWWRGDVDFGMVRAGVVLVRSLGVRDVVSLTLAPWPSTVVGIREEWRELWKETEKIDRVSVDYGGRGEEDIWDIVSRCLLDDTVKPEPGNMLVWPELRTLDLAGTMRESSVRLWLDWLDLRVASGLRLERLDVLARIAVDEEVYFDWDSVPNGELDWSVGANPVPAAVWRGRFRAVARIAEWSEPHSVWESVSDF